MLDKPACCFSPVRTASTVGQAELGCDTKGAGGSSLVSLAAIEPFDNMGTISARSIVNPATSPAFRLQWTLKEGLRKTRGLHRSCC